MNLAEAFVDLFDGNRAVQGTVGGSCVHVPWDVNRMAEHLEGVAPFGVYPMRPSGCDWKVKWGCVDIDEEDPNQAWNLVRALTSFGVTAHTERSRSKGYHVWVFASEWVYARRMRRTLLLACDLVGTTKREVNPKQEALPVGAVGNYVRLPYPKGHASDRQVVLHEDDCLTAAEFASLALANRTSPDLLGELADLYAEPPPPAAISGASEVSGLLLQRMSGLAKRIYYEGPLEGGDRSSTLYKLAAVLRECAFPPEDALAVVIAADQAWGKYHTRADGERRLHDLVASAYAGWEW